MIWICAPWAWLRGNGEYRGGHPGEREGRASDWAPGSWDLQRGRPAGEGTPGAEKRALGGLDADGKGCAHWFALKASLKGQRGLL